MFQLGKLYLQLALVGAGPLGEDIEDDTGAVQHPAFQFPLNIPLLAGAEGVIEQHHVSLTGSGHVTDFFQLAFPDKQSRAGLVTGTGNFCDRLNTGRCHQFPEFPKVFHGAAMGAEFDMNKHGPFTDIRTLKQSVFLPSLQTAPVMNYRHDRSTMLLAENVKTRTA
jgi:hypothetical protein